MSGAPSRVLPDPDLHPFATDVDKYVRIIFEGRRGPRQRLRMWLLDADFRMIACYRFTQASREWQTRHRVLGVGARLLAGVWRRRAAIVHHFYVEPRAQIGPGLLVMHRSGIFIGPVSIGDNCVLHHNVTIGQRVAGGNQGIPRLGDNVWIGPGATITGDITIGDGATISAGAVVSRDVPPRSLVAGNPGRVVRADYDNSPMLGYVVKRPDRRPDRVDRALAEYSALRDPDGDPELEAVKAAIFLEDTFDVVLGDDEIDPARLATPDGMRAAVIGAGGPRFAPGSA